MKMAGGDRLLPGLLQTTNSIAVEPASSAWRLTCCRATVSDHQECKLDHFSWMIFFVHMTTPDDKVPEISRMWKTRWKLRSLRSAEDAIWTDRPCKFFCSAVRLPGLCPQSAKSKNDPSVALQLPKLQVARQGSDLCGLNGTDSR